LINLPCNADINSDPNLHNCQNWGLGGGDEGQGNPSGGGGGNGYRGNDPSGNQDRESNDESVSSRQNNQHYPFPRNNGGGGGGNGPLLGRGNLGNFRNENQNQGLIPYGETKATIRNDLKQEQLPVWDGNKNTAIEYCWKVQQLAALEGDILQVLGYWLWNSLKENSKIWWWFSTLPFLEQAKMRTHYLYYIKGIKDNYLG